MDTIKTTALTLITMVACLMLLLTPEPQQSETPVQFPAPVKQNQPIPFKQAETITQDQLMSIERDQANQATLPALAAALNDPNPQLRIAALEALASQEDESVVTSIEPYLFDPDRIR